MSWVVRILLRKREELRTNPDIESDEYNDLLIVESKIKELFENDLLSDMDLYLLDQLGSGAPMSDLEDSLGISRVTISRIYSKICDRISHYLGGEFTDEGLLNKIAENNRLDSEEVEALRNYMSGKRRYQLMKNRIIDE